MPELLEVDWSHRNGADPAARHPFVLAAYCGWESRSSGLFAIDFLSRSPTVAGLSSPCKQLQAIVLGRILATAEPLHNKLMERSEFYRHCTEALMQRWIRSFRSIPPFLVVNFVDSLNLCSCRAQKWRVSSFCFDMPCRAFWILLRCLHSRFRVFFPSFTFLETSPLVAPL